MIKNNLFVQAIGKFLLGVILIGLLLFLSGKEYVEGGDNRTGV